LYKFSNNYRNLYTKNYLYARKKMGPRSGINLFRIPGSKRHRIPDPDPKLCYNPSLSIRIKILSWTQNVPYRSPPPILRIEYHDKKCFFTRIQPIIKKYYLLDLLSLLLLLLLLLLGLVGPRFSRKGFCSTVWW